MSYLEHPRYGKEVTPSDSVDLNATGPLYIGQSGDVKVRFFNDEDCTFKCVGVGSFPYIIKKLYATGTTAGEFIMTTLNVDDIS